jgi:sugar/nucleoside kinase (ribokinase family)
MKQDIVTFGSATVDIFAETADSDVTHLCTDNHCEDLLAYHPGDKVLLKNISTHIGGGGTNTAACFQKLGLTTVFAGALGRDSHGDQILDWMRENNIRFAGPRVDQSTNTSIILDSHKLHDRTILAYKGASDQLQLEHIELGVLHATWWYSSSLVKQSYKTLLELMRYAQQENIAFAFNPSAYQTQQGLEALRECVELSTVFVCNKQEAEMLVGVGNRAEICRRLRQEGAEIVCITEGKYGATLLYANTLYHIGSQATNIVETTGAGDCFASTLVAGFAQELSPKHALLRAAIHSEQLITQVGAKNGLCTSEQLEELMKTDQRVINHEKLYKTI